MRSDTGSFSQSPKSREGSQSNLRPGSPSLDPRKRRRTFDGRPNSPLSEVGADRSDSRDNLDRQRSKFSIRSIFSRRSQTSWKNLDEPYQPPKRSSTMERLGKLRAIMSPPGSRPNTPAEDESDDEEKDPELQAQRIRTSIENLRALTKDFESKRSRAFQYCGTVQHPDPDGKTAEGWWLRWQRKTGILEIRVRIHIREIQLEEEPPYYKDVYAIVKSIKFEAFFAVLILCNAICIGWDTFYDRDERRPFILDASEHFFTAMFLIEYIMRVMAFTCFWHLSLMNMFDTFLIWGTGVLMTWVLPPLGLTLYSARRLAALRILRLARLCRVIRIMRAFKELWMLVQGVMECTALLIWAIVIGGMVHFTFAVAVVELIAKSDQFKDDDNVQYYFGSTIRSMFSLFQIMTFDSWSGVVRPIVKKTPETFLLFGIFMGLTGIVLFNLMTAIVVRNAYDAGERDNEAVAMAKAQENAKLRVELLETFKELDEDGSGALSQEEFNDCLDDYLFVRKMKMLDIDLEELPDFFEILDDGDGEVNQQEFIGGMMKMQGGARACDMLRATTLLKQQNLRFSSLQNVFVREALETYTRMEGDVDRLHTGMNDVMHLTAEVMKKLDSLGVRQIMKSTLPSAPFVDEPELRDITKADKKYAAAKKHGKEKELIPNDIEELLPPEAKLEKIVPPSWIIREGRSWGAKNPGMVKLKRNPDLKEKLKAKAVKEKKTARKPASEMGVHRELGHSWNTLGMTREDSTLRILASETDEIPPSQMQLTPLVNNMVENLVPAVPLPPLTPVSKVDQAPPDQLALTPDMHSQLPDEESRKSLQHPHAISEDTLL